MVVNGGWGEVGEPDGGGPTCVGLDFGRWGRTSPVLGGIDASGESQLMAAWKTAKCGWPRGSFNQSLRAW